MLTLRLDAARTTEKECRMIIDLCLMLIGIIFLASLGVMAVCVIFLVVREIIRKRREER